MKTPNYNFFKAFWVTIVFSTTLSLSAQGPQLKWSQAGPIYTAGRARNMVVDKSNKSTLYVGSVSSGIFKSINGGSLWTPLNDQGKVRNISYLAQSANSTLWVGTGEGFIRYGQKAKALPGTGLYKLVGNDLIIAASATLIGNVINRIACHPTDANKMALTTNKGLYISTDGGASFNPAQIPNLKTDTTYGMDVKFASNGDLYCSVGNERGHSPFGTVNGRIFKSTDLNVFTNITPTSNVLADANYGRIELAISPSNPQIIYASCANKNLTAPTGAQSLNSASLKAIFVSYNGGSTWSLVLAGSAQLDPLSSSGVISTGDYAHVLLVDPDDANKLYIGGYNFYSFKRTNATSEAQVLGTWSQMGNPFARNTPLFLNANTHDIQIVKSGSSSLFYFVTDAGIYRSSDITSAVMFPSFQPFYKGFVTGQFNSVSIERYPLSPNAQTAANGSSVTPLVGFLGGTGGNGMTYYSGSESTVSQETNYLSGEIYNVEYSKILSNAAILTTGNGALYKSSNVKNTSPTLYDYNKYTGNINKLSPEALSFANTNMSTGTPFKLWENYGQLSSTPDMAVFYNDTLRVPSSITNFSVLNSQTQFTFAVPRPSRFSAIDSMVIRTGTVVLPLGYSFSNCPTPFTGSDLKDITVKLSNTYTSSLTSTNVVSSTLTTGPVQGAVSCSLNPLTKLDLISVNFSSAPFATKTITTYTHSAGDITDPSVYYRVFATIYYKYKTGDTISVTDNSISTMINTYKTVLTKPLSWAYGSSLPSIVITAQNNASIPNSTFMITPGGSTSTATSFTVNPRIKTNYTITQSGTYTLNPANFTITSPNNTLIPNSSFSLTSNNSGTTVIASNTTGIFSVPHLTTNTYNVLQSGLYTYSANPIQYTLTAIQNTAIPSSTYFLNSTGASSATATSSLNSFTVSALGSNSHTITQMGSYTFSVNPSVYTINITPTNAIPNSTFVLNPGNITSSVSVFTVQPNGITQYTITQNGTSTLATTVLTLTPSYNLSNNNSTLVINQSAPLFTLLQPTVNTIYTLTSLQGSINSTSSANASTVLPTISTTSASSTFTGIVNVTNYNIPSPSFLLMPGAITQTNSVFSNLQPTVNTTYTIYSISSNTLLGNNQTFTTLALGPQTTSLTLLTPTFVLFEAVSGSTLTTSTTVTVPVIKSPTINTTFTLTGVSSNTLYAANSNTTFTGAIATTFSTVGSPTVIFSANNPLIKIPTTKSARLAMILNNTNVTPNSSNPYAIVVSKAPLNLNDPLNFVRVSQSGCLSDSANGNPSTNTISVIGRPILLEWSKSGTELYYATDSNRVYRVSHITDIFDLSPASYSGKFYTDVFTYTTPVNSNTVNPNSPYRTTLIGKFDRPVTSISVSNDNKNVVLTFNNPDQSGSTGIVMYNGNDARTSNTASINWVKKDDNNLKNNATYCSLIEKDDGKKVFIGTDNGIFFTSDITANPAVWSNVNNNMLPNVQVFDIKQQTFPVNYCYNSGQIYVATNGRGIWTNSDFFSPQLVGIEALEFNEHDKTLHIFPNPSMGNCTFSYYANTTSPSVAQISDIRGTVIYNEIITPTETGLQTVSLQNKNLQSGLYFITLKTDNGQVKCGKLIVQQ